MKYLKNSVLRDPLTNLLNEVTTGIYVEHHIKNLESGKRAVFILVNIDQFQKMNEELGYVFMGEIVTNMAEELHEVFESVDVMGRKGNSSFIIFSTTTVTMAQVREKADRICKTLSKQLMGVSAEYDMTVSVGISLYSRDGLTYQELMDCAELALGYATVHESQKYEIYDISKLELYRKLQELNSEALADYLWEKKQNEAVMESKFDYELTDFAFSIMDEKKDADKAIQLILKRVAEFYNLSAVRIIEHVSGEYVMKCTHEWARDKNLQLRGTVWNTNEYQMTRLFNKIDSDNDRMYEEKGSAICNGVEQFEQVNVKSFLRCGMHNGGKYTGSIDFVDYETERNWNELEKRTLKTLTRIVSLYLLKVKAHDEAARAVEDLTSFDKVTGMLKYEKFIKRMRSLLPSIVLHSKPIVMNMDLSNFKYLNEAHGYQVGDHILKNFSEYISEVVPGIMLMSRVAADNIVAFAVLPDDISVDDCMQHFKEASIAFCQDINNTYSNIHLELNCGFYQVEDRRIDPENAVANANMARKLAKSHKQHECVLYTEELDQKNRSQIEMAFNMRKALENREFVVYYQPKIDSVSRKIIGAEALIRWQKPDGTLLYPNSFIPIFERTGTIVDLDFYVYDSVCCYLRKRLDANLPVVPVSMNVSRVHMMQDKIITYVENLMKQYQIEPRLLEFEITESLYVENLDIAIELVNKFKGLGVKVSIDDFGSGYSSLNVLRKLPIDILKLDKVFLEDYIDNLQDQIIIISIVDMAKKLKIKVLCEGIETEGQADFLEKTGCDFMQGFYFSKPVREETFSDLVDRDAVEDIYDAKHERM